MLKKENTINKSLFINIFLSTCLETSNNPDCQTHNIIHKTILLFLFLLWGLSAIKTIPSHIQSSILPYPASASISTLYLSIVYKFIITSTQIFCSTLYSLYHSSFINFAMVFDSLGSLSFTLAISVINVEKIILCPSNSH